MLFFCPTYVLQPHPVPRFVRVHVALSHCTASTPFMCVVALYYCRVNQKYKTQILQKKLRLSHTHTFAPNPRTSVSVRNGAMRTRKRVEKGWQRQEIAKSSRGVCERRVCSHKPCEASSNNILPRHITSHTSFSSLALRQICFRQELYILQLRKR